MAQVVLVEDECTRVLSIPGLGAVAYHCELVDDDGSVSTVVVDPCARDAKPSLDVTPFPGHVNRDYRPPRVEVVAFGTGSEPLHVVSYARTDDGHGFRVLGFGIFERPLAGHLISLGAGTVTCLRVLRVEELRPPSSSLSLCGLAERAGLSVEQHGVDPTAVELESPSPLRCAWFHVRGRGLPQPPSVDSEPCKALVAAWTPAACKDRALASGLGVQLERAAPLAHLFSRHLCVSSALTANSAIPPDRMLPGRCAVTVDVAKRLGAPHWSMVEVPSAESEDRFAFVSTDPLVAVIDTNDPTRAPVALYPGPLPPAWLKAHDASLYDRACEQWRRVFIPQ
jgi:hypothetical protein